MHFILVKPPLFREITTPYIKEKSFVYFKKGGVGL